MLRTFRSRILALVLGLVTVVLSATVVAVVVRAHAEVERQAVQQLRSAADTAREMLRFRGNQLTGAAEVLTADYGYKEAVASGDSPTLVSAINNHRARIGASAIIVFSTDGQLIASTLGSLSAQTQNDLQALVETDSDAAMMRLYRLIENRPYQLVLAPVLAPDLIGWTIMAFALDDKVAADMARVLGVDVSFVTAGAGTATDIESSLGGTRRMQLASTANARATAPFFTKINADEYLTWTSPIRANNGRLTLVLQRSMSEALRPFELLRQSILIIGAAALAVACALCALLARSATRPIDALIRAAERLEAGDYSVHVPPASTTELSRLASAFNAMGAAVADREATIRYQGQHDGLTRLPTLARISEILQELLLSARLTNKPLTVCLIEIQQFQDIIASWGHAAGDEVLWEIARRLTAGSQIEERVARIATDRFLVVLESVSTEQARALAEGITEGLRADFEYSGVSLRLETRVGIAAFPEDGSLPSELLQRAELALYRAKDSGATIGVFVRGDDESHRHRMSIVGQLRHAIASDQMRLFYQPKVALSTGRMLGCEALVRWKHPEKGFIPPSEFIPHAERTGLIKLLTAWVLSSALQQLRRWQEDGLEFDVSVNVSPTDISDPGFADRLGILLAQTGADSRRVVLEVTESAAMKDLPNTLRVMEQLRVLGIRFSIDDFGTGYSSLAHLKRLPVDEIKIDRSFIQELEARPDDDVIVRSTINLGHALGLKVVAEGVEIAASFDALLRYGCDSVQGYFVSKPMPEIEFSRWAREREATLPQIVSTRASRDPPDESSFISATDARVAG
jgi:diguanylate cyclase (GGDEF)-like protein